MATTRTTASRRRVSALILLDHVKEGVVLAREQGLPQPIVDAIEQHHGTRTVGYFLARAKERAEPGQKVNEHQYRYTGPMPQNKTMGVLMVADTVEAASRTLEDFSEDSIRKLVTRLLDDIVEDGQLDQTDLTLFDLRRLSYTLQNVLKTIHHHRVEYPGFEWDGEGRGSLRVLPGGAAGGAPAAVGPTDFFSVVTIDLQVAACVEATCRALSSWPAPRRSRRGR